MTDSQQPAPQFLPVSQVVDIVAEWVELHAQPLPGFAGAYLWGGITAMASETPFALYRDVDVMVICTPGTIENEENWEILYRGVILEVIFSSTEDHRDAHAALANPSRGPNLLTTTILTDPLGILAPLQAAVRAEFGESRWVRARCDKEKADARKALAAMRTAATRYASIQSIWELLNILSGLLAVATLDRPTTRRTLALLHDLLHDLNRPDLHERALALWGSAHLTQAEVELMLDQCAAAFSRAVALYQTPIPYGFMLRPYMRPYLVDGAREMIAQGYVREATFWILAMGADAYLVLSNDAPEPEKSTFAAEMAAMEAALGYSTPAAWDARILAAETLAAEIFRLADEQVARLE